jgi:hypothetical protein
MIRFYGYQDQDPCIFNNWLFEIDQFFEQVGLSNEQKKLTFPKQKLLIEPWSTGTMRTFTLDGICLQ